MRHPQWRQIYGRQNSYKIKNNRKTKPVSDKKV